MKRLPFMSPATRLRFAMIGVSAIALGVIGCEEKLSGPVPVIDHLEPAVVCVDQIATPVTLRGGELSPAVFGTLTSDPEVQLPQITLSRELDLNGDAASGAAVTIPDDPTNPETDRVRWQSQEAMVFTIYPELGMDAGVWGVVVVNPNTQSGSLGGALLAVGPPVLDSVVPNLICTDDGGRPVDLTGSGFLVIGEALPAVSVGSLILTPTYDDLNCVDLPGPVSGVKACTVMTVEVPPGVSPGAYSVSLTNPDPAACWTTTPQDLVVVPEPTLDQVQPAAICLASGSAADLVATGSDFLSIDGVLPSLTFDDGTTPFTLEATSADGCVGMSVPGRTVAVCDTLYVSLDPAVAPADSVPTHVVSAWDVVVANPEPAGCESNPVLVTNFPPPVVTSINGEPVTSLTPANPVVQICSGDAVLDIVGTGLMEIGAEVRLGGSEVASTAPSNCANGACVDLRAAFNLVPPSATAYDLTVDNGNGCDVTIVGAIDVIPGPVLLYADPRIVFDGFDNNLTVYATNFSSDNITLVELVPTDAHADDPAIILCDDAGTVPCNSALSGAASGWFNVVLPAGTLGALTTFATEAWFDLRTEVENEGCSANLADAVQVISVPEVATMSLAPAFGKVGEATAASIALVTSPPGVDFVATPRAYLTNATSGGPLRAVAFVSNTNLTAVVPDTFTLDSGGDYEDFDLTVTNADGTLFIQESAFRLSAFNPPRIEEVIPGQVPSTGGVTVAITGTGFSNLEVGEVCDGADLGRTTCMDLGFTGGILACNGSCTGFDTMTCTGVGPTCANDILDSGELCDGAELGAATCVGLGFDGGDLACDGTCDGFDTTGCTGPGPECGSGIRIRLRCEDQFGNSAGDYAIDPAVITYTDSNNISFAWPGFLANNTVCIIEVENARDDASDSFSAIVVGNPSGNIPSLRSISGCAGAGPTCGNNAAEGLELCDGTDLGIATCASQGFVDGALACDATCDGYDTSACNGPGPTCGNDFIEAPELCDGSALAGVECASLTGFTGGTLACNATCDGYDTSECETTAVCGNGILEADEVCDGAALGGVDCVDLGYDSGAPLCNDTCDALVPIGARLSTGRRAHGMVTVGATRAARFIYAAGGDTSSTGIPELGALDSVEYVALRFNGEPTTFRSARYSLETPRTFTSLVNVGRALYAIGGADDGAAALTGAATVERAVVLDPEEVVQVNIGSFDFGTAGTPGLQKGAYIYQVAIVFAATDPINPCGESLPSEPFVIHVPDVRDIEENPIGLTLTLTWAEADVASLGVGFTNRVVAGYRVYRTPQADAPIGSMRFLNDVALAGTISYLDDAQAPVTNEITGCTDADPVPADQTPLGLGQTSKWVSDQVPQLGTGRKGAGVAAVTDRDDPSRRFVYAVSGLDNTEAGLTDYEYLVLSYDPETNPTLWESGASWTAVPNALETGSGSCNGSTARWQAGLFAFNADNSSVDGETFQITNNEQYLFLGSGLQPDGTGGVGVLQSWLINGATGALDQTSYYYGCFPADDDAGYGNVGANQQIFVFGQNRGTGIRATLWERQAGTPPRIEAIGFNNNGGGMGEARYLHGTDIDRAFIYVLGGAGATGAVLDSMEYGLW